MPPVRERMRPWLVKQINSKAVSGLNWLDKEKTTFSIPWKHASRHGWEIEKDACLFQMWAVHTGKYGLGQESNPKTWKANFRCALNSLPDVVEVKDRSIQKGHEAMRVFKMLPVAQKSKDRRKKGGKTKSKRKIKIEEEDPDYEDSTKSPLEQSPQPEPSPTQESTVDSTVHTEQQDFTYMSLSEVPECSLTVEVGTENGYKFEVSPEHSPDSSNYDDNYNNFTIMIYQPMGKETHWRSLDGKGFLSNEPCTSPGSQWSEASSADDVDEPMYITLNTSFPSTTSDLWSSFELPKTLLEF